MPLRLLLPILLLGTLLVWPQSALADLVKLMNGGELRGKVLPSNETKQKIRLETITGAIVVVDRDETQFVTLRSPLIEEYETRQRRLDDTWESHWSLSEWCRQRGLTKQRETHLVRVTELSPDFDRAHLALGQVWDKGQWVNRDELMASQGYVKYKNKYITQQELDVIEKTSDEVQRERSWFQKVRLWVGWLNDSNPARSRQGVAELQNITDPHAASAVIKFMCSDTRAKIRELAATILIKISGGKAVAGLVQLALFDESPEVRAVAVEGIGRDYYQHAQLVFLKALKSEYNAVVCRAAIALGLIGDKKAVGPLIDSLVTAHHYQVTSDAPLNPTYSFTADGNFASNTTNLPPNLVAAVRTGQMLPPVMAPPSDPVPKKTVTVRVEHENVEVLAALEKLTEKNFGYDKRVWNQWWSAEKNQGGKAQK